MEKQEYSQLELFHKAEDDGISAQRLSGTFLSYIRTYERLVLMLIGIVITGVVCFCVGVEKGKHIALSQINSNLDIAYRNKSLVPQSGVNAVPVQQRNGVNTAQVMPRSGAAMQPSPRAGNSAVQAPIAGQTPKTIVPVPQAVKQPVGVPVQAKQPMAVAKAVQPSAGVYTIQIGSYAGMTSAQQEVAILKKQGLLPVLRASGKYTVLCVGNFPDQATARSLLTQLKRKYRDCYIRRL